MKVQYKRYAELEDVYAKFFRCPLSEVTKVTGVSHEGVDVDVNIKQMLRISRRSGVWGFADVKKGVIHYWATSNASTKNLLSFFSHELGHLQKRYSKDALSEEQRADSYADVCLEAVRMAAKVAAKRSGK